MSFHDARQFVDDVRNDPVLSHEMAGCADAAARRALAEARGYRFTAAELSEAAKGFGEDDIAGILYQESRLGYDSDLGHGQDPDPPRKPDEDEPGAPD